MLWITIDFLEPHKVCKHLISLLLLALDPFRSGKTLKRNKNTM